MAAMVVSLAGFGLAQSGSAIAHQTPISESFVGTTMTGVATSLPELITTIAAVRQGALTLAVGNIVGGNAFDSLFVAVGDAAYTEGSLFHAIQPQETFLMALTIFLTVILMMGLTFREKHGFANIGFESLLMLIVYLLGVGAIATM
jgi:cation:H+ antiporter